MKMVKGKGLSSSECPFDGTSANRVQIYNFHTMKTSFKKKHLLLINSSMIMWLKSPSSTFLLLTLAKPSAGLISNITRNRSAFVTSLLMTSSPSTTNNPLVDFGLPSPMVLGSGSYTRKLILKEMGIDYILKVRPIDEKKLGDRSLGSDPQKLVLTLAKAKGDHLVQGLVDPTIKTGNFFNSEEFDEVIDVKHDLSYYNQGDECIILTADQVVTHANIILEKPVDIVEAKSFVERYAESPPATVGAVVLTHLPSMIQVSGVDTATIHFKKSVRECNLIDKLLEDDAPVLDCAGGLMVEHPLVKEHIIKIDGTEDSVMGLSKDLVLSLMRSMKEQLDAQYYNTKK